MRYTKIQLHILKGLQDRRSCVVGQEQEEQEEQEGQERTDMKKTEPSLLQQRREQQKAETRNS